MELIQLKKSVQIIEDVGGPKFPFWIFDLDTGEVIASMARNQKSGEPVGDVVGWCPGAVTAEVVHYALKLSDWLVETNLGAGRIFSNAFSGERKKFGKIHWSVIMHISHFKIQSKVWDIDENGNEDDYFDASLAIIYTIADALEGKVFNEEWKVVESQ